jgi:hypothetical protein
MALAIPVDQPEPALVEKLGQPRRRDRPEMRVGEVGELEIPIILPRVLLGISNSKTALESWVF